MHIAASPAKMFTSGWCMYNGLFALGYIWFTLSRKGNGQFGDDGWIHRGFGGQ